MSKKIFSLKGKSVLLLIAVMLMQMVVPFASVSAAEDADAKYFKSPYNTDMYEMETFGSGGDDWYLLWKTGDSGAGVDEGYRSIDTTNYHSGTGSMRYEMDQLDVKDPLFKFKRYYKKTGMPVEIGKTYTISYWVKNESGKSIKLYPWVTAYSYLSTDSTNTYDAYANYHYNTGDSVQTIAANTDWQFITHRITIDDTQTNYNYPVVNGFTVSMRISELAAGTNAGDVYIDQLSFVETPLASQYAPVLEKKEYIYNGIDGGVVGAKLTFDGKYINEGTIVPTVDGTPVKYTSDITYNLDGKTIVTVNLASEADASKLVFNLRDIWGRAIADVDVDDSSAFVVSPFPNDIHEMSTVNEDIWKIINAKRGTNTTDTEYGVSNEESRSGGSSMRFGVTSLAKDSVLFNAVAEGMIKNPFKKGKTYTISYWVKNESGKELTVYPCHFQNYGYNAATDSTYAAYVNTLPYNGHANTGGQDCSATISSSDEWQYISHTIVATSPEGYSNSKHQDVYSYPYVKNAQYQIVVSSITAGEATGDLYVDNFSIVETPTADELKTILASKTATDNVLTLNFDTGYVEAGGITADLSGVAAPFTAAKSNNGKTITLTCDDAVDASAINVSIKDIWGRTVRSAVARGNVTYGYKAEGASTYTSVADQFALIGMTDVVVKVNVDIINSTGREDVIAFVACFQGGDLASIDRVDVSPTSAEFAELPLDVVTSDTEYKVFIWEDGSLRPLVR